MDEEKITFPEPDAVLMEKPSIKKYIKYISFFGPGAIVASATIGQGQLILGPQIGAWAGYKLLWLITLSVASYIVAYVSCRFMLLSGINMTDIFAIKTKKGFLNWIFIAIIFIFVPLFAAAIVTTLGQSLAWIAGEGHYLLWGISFCLLAAILAVAGRYKLVEYTQAFFVAVLGIGAIASLFIIKPDILKMLPNFFLVGNVPAYPAWVNEQFPSVAQKPVSLIMLGYIGTLTFTIVTLVGYSGWVKVKRWGIFKGKKNADEFSQNLFNKFKEEGKINYLPDDSHEIKKSRILLKPMLIDISIAFVIVAIVSSAYMIAGEHYLGPQDGSYKLPTDINLLKEQAIIFSDIAPWLKPLYQISVFFALFGTVYAGFEAASRMVYETSKNVVSRIMNIPYKKFMFYFLIYILVTGIPLAIIGSMTSIILMLSITLLFIGVIGVIIYGIGAIYMSQKFLPEKYKLGNIALAVTIMAVILLIVPMFFLFI